MRERKTYPDWVEKFRTDGTTVKLVRGRYYLYKRNGSRRVEGKRNPQPVDEYIGVITEKEGLVPGKKKRVRVDGIEVREYGFSRAMMDCCPDSWKQIHGDGWRDLLKTLIVSRSPNSFLLDEGPVKGWDGHRGEQRGAVAASLQRKLQEEYGLKLDDLQLLETVFLVRMGDKVAVSNIHDAHREILQKVGCRLEVR